MQQLKFGRTSTNEEPRSGRPSDAITSEMIKKMLRLVTDDHKLKVCKISMMLNISKERVHNLFQYHLNMRKLCARWKPRVRTNQQELERADVSQ